MDGQDVRSKVLHLSADQSKQSDLQTAIATEQEGRTDGRIATVRAVERYTLLNIANTSELGW